MIIKSYNDRNDEATNQAGANLQSFIFQLRFNIHLVRSNFHILRIQSILRLLIRRFEARKCIHEPSMIILQLLSLKTEKRIV